MGANRRQLDLEERGVGGVDARGVQGVGAVLLDKPEGFRAQVQRGLSLNKIWWQTLFHHGTRRGRAGSAPREPRAGQWDEREDFGLQRLRQCYKLLGRTGLQGRQSAVDRLSELSVLDITKGRRVDHNPDVFVRAHTSASVERAVEPVRLQGPSGVPVAACTHCL